MSVRKRLESTRFEKVDVDALIDKGAPVKGDFLEEKKWRIINLRIKPEMLSQIDSLVKKRVGINRSGWILETLYERLERENQR